MVAVPAPGGAAAEGEEHAFGEDFGEGAAEAAEQREAEQVDPDVVVFPVGSRRLKGAWVTFAWGGGAGEFAGEGAVAVDPLGFAEQGAFPFRGLLQEVSPGDGGVVGGGEFGAFGDGGVEVGDQAVTDGDAGDEGEVAFGDGEGHVDLGGVAPLRDLAAALQDQAVGGAAGGDGAEDGVVGRGFEGAGLEMGLDVAGPGGFVGLGEGDGFGVLGHIVAPASGRWAAPR